MTQFNAESFNAYEAPPGEPPRTSLLAVTGFVSSLIFCCPLTSLVGLVLGVGGLVSVSSSNGRRKGTGLAVAAIVISLLSMATQVYFGQKLIPAAKGWWGAGMMINTGPTEFLSDLEVGDLQSARTHLYPDFSAVITDGQLRYFAEQVRQRYGSAQAWTPPQNPPFNPSQPGEASFDIIGSVQFGTQTLPTMMQLKVFIGQMGTFEKFGISRLVIQDPTLGDLVLDESTPEAPATGGNTAPPGGEGAAPPDEGEGGG